MSDDQSPSSFSPVRWVVIPVLITLAVTVLRLVGERNHWNSTLFNGVAADRARHEGVERTHDAPGGQLALIGIVWLVPIFGIYFARKLVRIGLAPARPGRTIGLYFAVAAFMEGSGVLMFQVLKLQPSPGTFTAFAVVSLVTVALAYAVWPALGKVLFLYGLGARLPVAAIATVAMLNNWQTHYDRAPPDFPELPVWQKVITLGVSPQLTLWMAFTMVVGGVFGAVTAAFAAKRERAALQS